MEKWWKEKAVYQIYPRSFLDRLPDGGVLDEVQRAPELLSYLQSRVDADGRMGLFLLTGSQQFGLLSGITQSLAGRTAFIELLPFSIHELQNTEQGVPDLHALLFGGGYPPIYDRKLSPAEWFPGRSPSSSSGQCCSFS